MRVGIVDRTDLGKIYLADVENTSQRNFSSQPKGQSRYFRRPTDAELQVPLDTYAFLSLRGSDTNATVDTSSDDTLRIRVAGSYVDITVTAGVATAKTTIRDDLNAAFLTNSYPFVASVVGTNQLQIDTTTAGQNASLDIDTIAGGCTLSTAVGFTDGATLTPLTLTALRTAVYPTTSTIDVSSATVVALSTFTNLTTAQQADLVDGIADVIAPSLIETGPALLSFAYGNLSKLRDAAFQPGGARIGLTAGVAVAVLADDGVTPFTL